MPTFVGILTFMSKINSCSAELSMKSFITSGGQLLCKVIYSSGGHFVLQSRTGLKILVVGLMRNICVKLFEFQDQQYILGQFC